MNTPHVGRDVALAHNFVALAVQPCSLGRKCRQVLKADAAEVKEREAADALIKSTTQPSSATTRPIDAEAGNDDFKTDWRETLKGINFDMLWSDDATAPGALQDAVENYWRDTNYKDLMIGGLRGVQTPCSRRTQGPPDEDIPDHRTVLDERHPDHQRAGTAAQAPGAAGCRHHPADRQCLGGVRAGPPR